MLVRKAFKFRLYPNKKSKDPYQISGGGLIFQDTCARLTTLNRSPDREWPWEANSQVLQQSLNYPNLAFSNLFAGRCRYPGFKSRRGKQAIRYSQVRFWVKTRFHRSPEEKNKNVTVSRTKSDRYYVSLQVREWQCPRCGANHD
jgi:putative transposase